MGKRKRTYNTNLIKKTANYSIFDIRELFSIHKATVRHWIKDGLKKMDERRPILIHGSDLFEFLKNRQNKNKRKCKPDELYCLKCREPRKPKEMKVKVEQQSEKISRIIGFCIECDSKMFRAFSIKNSKSLSPKFEIIRTGSKNIIQSNPSVVNAHLKEEA